MVMVFVHALLVMVVLRFMLIHNLYVCFLKGRRQK